MACTHEGTKVNIQGQIFDCQNHGARFSSSGEVARGHWSAVPQPARGTRYSSRVGFPRRATGGRSHPVDAPRPRARARAHAGPDRLRHAGAADLAPRRWHVPIRDRYFALGPQRDAELCRDGARGDLRPHRGLDCMSIQHSEHPPLASGDRDLTSHRGSMNETGRPSGVTEFRENG
jgi:hypothetical protein